MSQKVSQNFAVFVPEKCHLSQKNSLKIPEWLQKKMACMYIYKTSTPEMYIGFEKCHLVVDKHNLVKYLENLSLLTWGSFVNIISLPLY